MTAPTTDNAGCHGLPRIKAGKAGEAVHLRAVLHWLQEHHEVTRAAAVTDYLLPAFAGKKPPVLYLAQPGGNAVALADDRAWHATPTGGAGSAGGRRVFSRGVGQGPATSAQMLPSIGQGLVGAVAWLQWAWANPKNSDAVLDHAEGIGAWLLVSKAAAAVAWGWAEPVVAPLVASAVVSPFPLADWPALVAYRTKKPAKSKGPNWALGNQIAIGCAELKRRMDSKETQTDALNAMGRELGLASNAGHSVLKRALFGDRKRQPEMPQTTTHELPVAKLASGKRAAWPLASRG